MTLIPRKPKVHRYQKFRHQLDKRSRLEECLSTQLNVVIVQPKHEKYAPCETITEYMMHKNVRTQSSTNELVLSYRCMIVQTASNLAIPSTDPKDSASLLTEEWPCAEELA